MNELASSFIREMIGGVSNALLNNPVVSWDNGFIRLIAAICALVALTNVILSIRDTNAFASKALRFIFFFTLLLMNFGIINPRTFFDFQLGDYEYINRTEVNSSDAAKTLGLTVMKPKATLDRDIYNAMSRFFDDVAKTIEGGLKGNDGGEVSEGEDVQTQAVKNTIFFLWQVRLAKMQCHNNSNTPEYVECLKGYIPYEATIATNGKPTKAPQCKRGGATVNCGVEGEKQIEQGSGEGAANAGSGGFFGAIGDALGGDSITKMVSLFINFFSMVYFIFTDFAFVVALPVILWVLEIIRNIVTLYFIIRFGFQASLLLIFAKIMSPLMLIESKWSQVKDAYMMVFSTTLFGFMSKLFIMAASILSLGLYSATYKVIAPAIYESGSGIAEAVALTAKINGMVYLVYFAIFVILLLQTMAMTKVDAACQAFLNFSVSEFVGMGKQIVGAAINVGLAAAGMAVAAPLAGGALLAGKAGMGAAGALKAGAGVGKDLLSSEGRKRIGEGIRNSASNLRQGFGGAGDRFGSMVRDPSGTMRNVASRGMNSIGSSTESMFGTEAGDKARQLFGSQGGGRKSPTSVGAAPNTAGAGYDEVKNGGSAPAAPAATSTPDTGGNGGGGSNSQSGASTTQKLFNPQGKKNKGKNRGSKNSSSSSSRGGPSSNYQSGASAQATADDSVAPAGTRDAFGDLSNDSKERKAHKEAYADDTKLPSFFQNPAIRAAVMAGNVIGGITTYAETGSFKSAMNAGKNGMGSQLQDKFRGASERVNNLLNKAYTNDKVRNSISSFNRRIDNVDTDLKVEAANNLQNSIQASGNVKNLDAKSTDQAVVADYEKFKAYTGKAELSETEMADLARINNQYMLNKTQNKTMMKYSAQNEEYAAYAQNQKAESDAAIQAYLKNSNTENASNLQSMISSGQVSYRDVNFNQDLTSRAQARQEATLKEFDKKLSEIDENKLSDPAYANSREVQSTMAQAERFASNNNNVDSLIGSEASGVATNLGRIGLMDKDYAKSLGQIAKEKDLAKQVEGFKGTIQMLSKKVDIGDGRSIVMNRSGEIKVFHNGTEVKNISSLSINDIKNPALVELLTQQKAAHEILRNQPQRSTRNSEDFGKMAGLFNFIRI